MTIRSTTGDIIWKILLNSTVSQVQESLRAKGDRAKYVRQEGRAGQKDIFDTEERWKNIRQASRFKERNSRPAILEVLLPSSSSLDIFTSQYPLKSSVISLLCFNASFFSEYEN